MTPAHPHTPLGGDGRQTASPPSPAHGCADRREPDFGARLMTPLLLGALLNPVNSTMIATTLVAMGHAFGVGAEDTAWLVGSLYLASAVAQPTLGRLADLLGPRRVFVGGLLVVAVAGLVGTLAPAFGWLILSRVLLGIGTSAAYPCAMAVLRARSHRLGRPTPRPVLARLSLAALGSAAVGPVLGGLLAGSVGWRGIFAVNIPVAAVALFLALRWLPRDGRPAMRGAAVRARAEGTPRGRQSAAGGLRTIGRHRPLLRTYLRHGLAYLVIYAVMYGYAQWLEESHGFSSFHAGLLMLPMSVAAGVCSLLGARTKGIRGPLTLAALLLAGGSAVLVCAHGSTPAALLLSASVLFGLPQGLTGTSNQAAVAVQAPLGAMGAAAGLQRTSQYLGALGAAGLIGLCYGQRADDAGLHLIALTAGALSLSLLALTLTDRSLRASS